MTAMPDSISDIGYDETLLDGDPSKRLPGENDVDYWERQVLLARELTDEDVYIPDPEDDLFDPNDPYATYLKYTNEVDSKSLKFAKRASEGLWDPEVMRISRAWADISSKGWLFEFVPVEGSKFTDEFMEEFYGDSMVQDRLHALAVKGRGGQVVEPFLDLNPYNILIGTAQRQWRWKDIEFEIPQNFDWEDPEDSGKVLENVNTLWFLMQSLGISPGLLEPSKVENSPWVDKTLGAAINADAIRKVEEVNLQIERINQETGMDNALLEVPTPIHRRPSVIRGGLHERGLFLDVLPADGSDLSASELGKIDLPVVQRVSRFSDVTVELSPNGIAARYIFSVRMPEDPTLSTSWTPPERLLPRGGGKSVAHSIKTSWTPRLPMGSSLPGQEVLWLDFLATPHVSVLGGTASGKSWSLLSWITEMGGDFLGWQLVIVDGKNSGDFSSLLNDKNYKASGVRSIATTPEESFVLLKWLDSEFTRRSKVSSALKKRGILEAPFPQLVGVIDEIAFLMGTWPKKTADSASSTIDQALKAYRQVNMHLVLCAQNPRDAEFPNKWLGNTGMKISMGKSDNPMIQKKILGDTAALDKYPEAKSFVVGGAKGRGVMAIEDAKKGEIVTAFRSSHVWSPSKALAAPESGVWDYEEEAFYAKRNTYAKRFGFKFSDDADFTNPEEFLKSVKVLNLDDNDFEPLPDRSVYNPSSMDYEPWTAAGGSGLEEEEYDTVVDPGLGEEED